MSDQDRYFCGDCQRWTPLGPKSWGGARCWICCHEYQCGSCGSEIDREGNCQRFVLTGKSCPSDGVA